MASATAYVVVDATHHRTIGVEGRRREGALVHLTLTAPSAFILLRLT